LLGDRIHLPGHVDDAYRYMRAFDLFVLPSDYEGLSFALIEAMAVGLPIVATDVEGSGEAIVDGSNGLLVQRGSAGALAEAIARIAGDSERAGALGQAAQESFRANFQAVRMVEDTLNLYRRLLGG
jgi:glycosyltransferase involved in cell wall biosynthesis